MNPDNISGFSTSNNKPTTAFSSNSRSSTATPGLSRPRLCKVRKQLGSQTYNARSNLSSAVGGFNPFLPPPSPGTSVTPNDDNDNAFVFGLSRSGSREDLVADQMGKLHLGNGHKGRFHNRAVSFDSALEIQKGVDKLNIRGGEKDERVNVGSSKEGKVVRNEKGSVNDRGGEFVFKSGSKTGGDSFVGDELPNRMKNLNLKNKDEGGDRKVDDKGVFIFGSSNQVGERETVLSNEMGRKLNIRSGSGDFSRQKGVGSSSSRMFVKDNRTRNLGDSKFQDLGKSVPSDFTFQIVKEVNREVGESETVLTNELGTKLNIANETSDFSEKTGVGSLPSRMFMKDDQTQNLDSKKYRHLGKSGSMEFSFQAAQEVNDGSGNRVHVDHHKPARKVTESGAASFSLSSIGVNSQPNFKISEVASMSATAKMNEFSSTRAKPSAETTFVEFKTPHQKTNLFSSTSQNLEFNAKKDPARDSKGKARKGKLKQGTAIQFWPKHDFITAEIGSGEKLEPADSYSPMEVSPYREETVTNSRCSRENSVASYDSETISIDEDLIAAAERMDINEGDVLNIGTKKENYHRDDSNKAPPEKTLSRAETESFVSAYEEMDFNVNCFRNSDGTEASSSLNLDRQDSVGSVQSYFSSCSTDAGGSSFTFAASQDHVSSSKQLRCKKSWNKAGYHSFNSTADINAPHDVSSLQFPPLSGATQQSPSLQDERGEQFAPPRRQNSLADRVQEREVVPNLTSSASIAAQEACEKWRLRGNQAYTNGLLLKAEDCYTQGINCVSKSETSRSCLRALVLCYSNRAATYMSIGKMRDALRDCMMAAALDPNFLRVQVRAANCYLALGEIEDASRFFRKCGSDICVDRKVPVEASDGLKKAQKVADCMQRAAELLQNKTSDTVVIALEVIDEALSISLFSEKLLEMKVEALFRLRKYEEVIQLCEQTMESAEKNSPRMDADGQPSKDFTFRLWRSCFIFKSYFNLGKLEEAIASFEKLDKLGNVDKSLEALIPLATTVRELLHHKAAGNEAFQSGRHTEAVEHYTAALSMNVESRSFAAICFCNRAAAYKALGHITDAIADCSLAIALDGNYLKAISRRATLYEMIRDYWQAASDLRRLTTLLTKQVELATQSEIADRSSKLASDLRQARMRLAAVEEEARKDTPLDMYLILDVEPSVSAADIKKAYRKAALRHHPDKAGQSLVRSDNGDEGVWREIAAEVHKDADRLFKMIGEAYAVLSDPIKRSRYDSEEETRNAQKKRNGNNAPRTHTDAQNYPFESSSSRRQWRDVWRSYGATSSTRR